MGKRLDVDWTESKLTDEHLWDVFHVAAKRLSGLTLQEHANGRVLILIDAKGLVRHVVSNLDDNNWGCFCADALDGECAATSYARVRLLKDQEDQA